MYIIDLVFESILSIFVVIFDGSAGDVGCPGLLYLSTRPSLVGVPTLTTLLKAETSNSIGIISWTVCSNLIVQVCAL